MRRPINRPSALALALALGIGCAAGLPQAARAADDGAVQESGEDAYDSFLDYSHEQRDAAIDWADRQLAAIEARIDELERDWDRSETRDDLEALKADLAERQDEAEEELEELGESGEDAWQDAKVETKNALSALERAYRDTRRRIAD